MPGKKRQHVVVFTTKVGSKFKVNAFTLPEYNSYKERIGFSEVTVHMDVGSCIRTETGAMSRVIEGIDDYVNTYISYPEKSYSTSGKVTKRVKNISTELSHILDIEEMDMTKIENPILTYVEGELTNGKYTVLTKVQGEKWTKFRTSFETTQNLLDPKFTELEFNECLEIYDGTNVIDPPPMGKAGWFKRLMKKLRLAS